MISVKRTHSDDTDFQELVYLLDKDLAERNGEKNDFFAKYNRLDRIKHVVIIYKDNYAVGCGAMKSYDQTTMEIKRMFVKIDNRGEGLAGRVLEEIEHWAKELGYSRYILETGDKMSEAIHLYKKHKYKIIQNYGQYENVASSICFEKQLNET